MVSIFVVLMIVMSGQRHTGIQIKPDMRILLPLAAIVVWATPHNLYIERLYARVWRLRGDKAAQRDYRSDRKSDSGEEAKDILQPHQGGMHSGR